MPMRAANRSGRGGERTDGAENGAPGRPRPFHPLRADAEPGRAAPRRSGLYILPRPRLADRGPPAAPLQDADRALRAPRDPMKQLLQNLRDGTLTIEDAPLPGRPPGFVLVANRASLISSGTERSTVQAARASLVGKARQRPDKVRQVLESVRKEGLGATVRKVREKLSEPEPLGYATAGVVLEPDEEGRFAAGDRVACAGAGYAVHAEAVAVPRNLVTRLPDGVSFEQGAFATLGAIALQGVRRAQPRLGDRVLVIGLGLLGQLTWQLLRANGCEVIGTDVSERSVALARSLGLERAHVRGTDDIEGICAALTDGHGVDSVLITAATKSTDPIELAGAAARERARVVVVGLVPMDVPREPYYRKELDVVISRSYGPGRYDAAYEERGIDYPYAQVRWTEGRNLQAFVEAIASGGVSVDPLITHRFPFESAPDAYRLVSGERQEFHLGIVLRYPEEIETERRVTLDARPAAPSPGRTRVAFLGAGSFARSYLLPHLKDRDGVELLAVATSRGYTATRVGSSFGFAEARSDAETLAADERVDAVFIATRHDQHGPLAKIALDAGKHVFVEKPLAVSPAHLDALLPSIEAAGTILQVGFNRRFSPLAARLRASLESAGVPVHVTYRVNAGPLPQGHWLLDPDQGGGRIVGEGCHFVDLVQFLTGSDPARVTASQVGDDASGVTSMLLEMHDGSTATIVYQANASSLVRKERVEAFAGGRGGIIDDWGGLELLDGRSRERVRARGQQKGFAEEIDAFLGALAGGRPAIAPESLVLTTRTTFAALESIRTRRPVDVSLGGAAGA